MDMELACSLPAKNLAEALARWQYAGGGRTGAYRAALDFAIMAMGPGMSAGHGGKTSKPTSWLQAC